MRIPEGRRVSVRISIWLACTWSTWSKSGCCARRVGQVGREPLSVATQCELSRQTKTWTVGEANNLFLAQEMATSRVTVMGPRPNSYPKGTK